MAVVMNRLVGIALKRLVINYGRGLQNGKIAGRKLFVPPPQDRVKLVTPPFLKGGNFLHPPNHYS